MVYFFVLWWTASDVGYVRDEGYYFKAAEEYAGWWGVLFSSRFFEAFGDTEILKYFSYNTEHPPLVKLSQGVSYHLFHRALGLAEPAQGFRAAGFAWASLSVFATYLLGSRLANQRVGLFAAFALATLPRYFFHAHLACFDVAMTAMWTLSLWSFDRAWRAESRNRVLGRSLTAGVVFGLALATKLNALFLPFVFIAMWLVRPPDRVWPRLVRTPGGGADVQLPSIPVPLVVCAIVGPLVFIASWPYLWHSTFTRIGGYLQFHFRHEHYPISYFHELYVAPPFPLHFPFVMSAITIPSPLWFLGVAGLVVAVREVVRRSVEATVIVAATLIPIALIALPTSPIFGGVKHWFNAMPTLLIAAGTMLEAGLRTLRVIRPKLPIEGFRWLSVAVVVTILAPGVLGTASSHPNGIGYYNALVGGFRGGAELGMQRGFWGGLVRPAFDALPARGRVFFNRLNYDSYRMYRREGQLPSMVSYASDAKAAAAAIVFEQPEHAETEADIWSNLGTRPVAGTYADGVTLTQIYLRGASTKAPSATEP